MHRQHRFGIRLALLAAVGLAGGACAPGADGGPGSDPDTADEAAGDQLPPFEWPVPTAPIKITKSERWKNRITAKPFEEPFLAFAPQAGWIKFVILMRDPTKVYFQDSNELLFHADFATQFLNPFKGMTRDQFDQVSLFENDQEAILGAVLFPPTRDIPEYAIQLVRHDAFHPEMARIVIELVEDSIDDAKGLKPIYFPSFEQQASVDEHRAFFDAKGIAVGSMAQWAKSNICYSNGWALGRIRNIPAGEIQAAFVDGRLTTTDILLTDGVPAEVPPVAGILSLAAATPNSHVAILANTFGVPFAFLALPDAAEQAQALDGKEVMFEAAGDGGGTACVVSLLDMDGALDPASRADMLALKAPPKLAITAKQKLGAISKSVDKLKPIDIKFFGGKASNYGALRRAIPDNSHPAIGFSFDLWDQFMDQKRPAGGTLRAEIAGRLAAFSFPPDVKKLESELDAIRKLIKKDASFSAGQRDAIFAALKLFDPNKNIRFRSSTNVEDTATFSGAGLYDSFSGCLADDLDADTAGPSLCDPTEADEKGVLRAIQKVYASFYNTNAFLTRLRHSIDEDKVGMAMLTHVSSPDDTELANGVGTLTPESSHVEISLVTQVGAESVTNPTGEAQPELAQVFKFSGDPQGFTQIRQPSDLVPIGGSVLEMPADYELLTGLIEKARIELIKSMGAKP